MNARKILFVCMRIINPYSLRENRHNVRGCDMQRNISASNVFCIYNHHLYMLVWVSDILVHRVYIYIYYSCHISNVHNFWDSSMSVFYEIHDFKITFGNKSVKRILWLHYRNKRFSYYQANTQCLLLIKWSKIVDLERVILCL